MDVESLFSPHVEGLEAYTSPDWDALAARAGMAPDQLLRLDANENPYGPSPRVAEALARYEGYEFYTDYRRLAERIAGYAGVPPENVVLGNGGDEIIDLAVRLFVIPGESAIVCPPTFEMYTVSTEAHHGRILRIPRKDDFSLDVEGLEEIVGRAAPETRPKLLFVTSPDNPDGGTIPLETIRRLLRLPLAVVVDEAYIEFGGESMVPLLADHGNLVVLRTFSKWAGMAGLRLGYAVASPVVTAAMERLRPPYNVSAAAVVAALATFEDMDWVQATIGRIVAERERLSAALAALPGVQPLPSEANFCFCWLEGRSGRELAGALAERGILIRSFSDPRLAAAVRITVGRPEQNDALIAALQEILGLEVTIPAVQGTPAPESRPRARQASIQRRTGETSVEVDLALDGTGRYEVDTGLGFLDHMLAQIAAHGLFDLKVGAEGDLEIDEHHTVEDVAIVLGQALDAALDDRRGLVRMGQAYAPLDEVLAQVVVDLSGRPYAVIDVEFATPSIGAVGSDLIIHFLETLAFQARMSLHARVLYGRNDHHKAEALFKALGRALDAATRQDPRRTTVPSTKGVL
jgi:histidinol-phosphate aminotransferase